MAVWNERKARLGVDNTFWWRAPAPLDPATVPVLTVRLPTGNVSPVLTPIFAPQDASSVAEDRRTLALGGPPIVNAVGIQGRYGHAWLKTVADGVFSVKIVNIPSGNTAVLADTLPRPIFATGGFPATIQWAWWSATLTAVAVTGTAARNVPWDVTYQADFGADIPDNLGGEDRGLLHVVRHPFSTGASTAALVDRFPQLAQTLSRRQVEYQAQLEAAERELLTWVRQDVAPRSEDAILGDALLETHLYLAAAAAIEETEQDKADRYRVRAADLYERAMRVVPWIDVDGDGVVDGGEAGQQVTGPRSYAGFVNTTAGFTPDFTIGQDH